MDFLEIFGEGGQFSREVLGSVAIQGAKNAALPVLAASLLFSGEVTVQNLPDVVDAKTLLFLLQNLGATITRPDPKTAKISAQNISQTTVIYDIVRKMRASILVLGPLLARFGRCDVSLPGGCAIGVRPVDFHIAALIKMGADISVQNGYIHARCDFLKGAVINFPRISVTGTENILMAAALARGHTQILNAAKEPEVIQLCEMLKSAGVEISGIGTSELKIRGTDGQPLQNACVKIIPDRIEAGTYLCVGGILNRQISVKNVAPDHMNAILQTLKDIGFGVKISTPDPEQAEITLLPAQKLQPFFVSTAEHPDFPTDMQAQFMALATQCEGKSVIIENLFENRFMHVAEFLRLGANINLHSHNAQIFGPTPLKAADVMATDLRASFALVLGGLIAQGKTTLHRIYHLDRGYEKMEEKLRALGLKIKRKKR